MSGLGHCSSATPVCLFIQVLLNMITLAAGRHPYKMLTHLWEIVTAFHRSRYITKTRLFNI